MTTGAPKRPRGMQGEARRMWDAIVAALPDRAFSPVDTFALEAACTWWAKFVQEMAAGHTNAADKASKRFEAFCARFGLSPVDRARLAIPPAPDEETNPFKLLEAAVLARRTPKEEMTENERRHDELASQHRAGRAS